MSENKKELACGKCNQAVPLIGANRHTGGNRTIIQVDLGKYEYERENLKRAYLCLSCWEQEKDKYLPKIKEGEYSACKRKFTKFITENDSPWEGAEHIYSHNLCKICQKSFFNDETFWETCSASCQRRYDNLSSEEKEKRERENYHKKRFIVYLVLWICSGIITGIISALGALAGASLGGVDKAIGGGLIFMIIGSLASIAFLVLWIYHLVKWVSEK